MLWIILAAILIALVLYLSSGARPGRGSKRCSRCFCAVDALQPYMDGRREFWICAMCAAELDFSHADRVDLPRR